MWTWLQKNRGGILLNLGATTILGTLTADYLAQQNHSGYYDPFFEACGKWALRFLLLCLLMTPLNTLFGWRSALRLRKPAGLWAFAFAALHFLSYTQFRPLEWQRNNPTLPDYIVLGIVALGILVALAITSHRWAMKILGRWWKRLHRLVYAAGGLTVVHAIVAYGSAKKGSVEGYQQLPELQAYLLVMIALLALRLPFVKALIHRMKRRRSPAITPIQAYSVPTQRPQEPVYRQLDLDPCGDVAADGITIAENLDRDTASVEEELHEPV